MIGPVLAIFLAVALVALGGLFSAIDSALITVSQARADELVREGRPGARRVVRVVRDKARYVNLMVLLRIVCEVLATVMLADALLQLLSETQALVITASIMALVAYIVIGVGPRTLGRQHAYSIILIAAWPLPIMATLLGPLTRLLILLGNAITPGKGFRNGPFATEIELREIVDLAQERGVVAADEGRMIQSVFELGDTAARGVMVPRPEMVWIEADKTIAQAASLAVRSGHSRIPVIGENVDDVLGVVYLRDLVGHMQGNRGATLVSTVMRPPVFVPDSKPLDTLLAEMQRDRNHMALLVDEYGGIAGLVTIEDVLEEIVGEIADEYDGEETPPIEDLGNGKYRVSARLRLEELGELFDIEIEDDEVETVGGLLGHQLGRVPLPGSKIESHGLVFRGEGGSDERGRIRVNTVLVKRAGKAKQPEPAASVKRSGERKKEAADE